jgi:cation diffusion facilitator family transporter
MKQGSCLMSDCCNDKACEIEALHNRQSTTLRAVLVINAVMFVVELAAGLIGGSVSLLADSLDMLGDTLVYGLSIYVITRGAKSKAVAALVKGCIMAVFGFFVLGQVLFGILQPHIPHFEAMGIVGFLALMANGACLFLLWRHRTEDINMTSVWLCSRNDIIANISVMVAAGLVWFTNSNWPDILVGFSIAALFLRSSFSVLRGSVSALRTPQT